MTPAQFQRLIIAGLATAMVLWTGCFTFLWGWAYDTSDASFLVSLLSILLSAALAVPLPSLAARVLRRLVAKAKADPAQARQLWAATGLAPDGEVQNAPRLLACACILAVLCGLACTGAVSAAAGFREAIAKTFLWDSFTWRIVQLLVQLLAMLPLGFAFACLFRACVIFCGEAGTWAATFRFWLLGLAGGLTLWAAIWSLGVGAAAGAMGSAAILLIVAVKLLLGKPLPSPINASSPATPVATTATTSANSADSAPAAQVPAPTSVNPGNAGKKNKAKDGKINKQGKQGGKKQGKEKSAYTEPLPLLAVLESANPPAQSPASSALPIPPGASNSSVPTPTSLSPLVLPLVALSFAVLMLTVLLQGVMLRELAGAGPATRALWTMMGALLLTMFLRRADERSELPSWEHGVGAAVGVAAGLAMQWGLAWACARAGAWLVIVVMLAGEPPLAALAATIISRHRRLAIAGGASIPKYLVAALLGSAMGGLVYAAIFLLPAWWLVLWTLAAILALSLLWAISKARKHPFAAQWTGWSAAILLSAVGAIACTRGLPAPTASGQASESITRTVGAVIAATPGQWWVASSTPLPANSGNSSVQISRSAFWSLETGLIGCIGNEKTPAAQPSEFFLESQTQRDLYDGMYLQAGPVDSPDAWRVFNTQTLERCLRRTQPRGIIMVRVQTSADNLGPAISAAKTFHAVVGDGWAVVYFGAENVDVLLVSGPAQTEPSLAQADGAFVVSIDKLWKNWDTLRVIDPLSPVPFWQQNGPTGSQFQEWLKTAIRGQ